jgi:type IV pilus assembly protein PilA
MSKSARPYARMQRSAALALARLSANLDGHTRSAAGFTLIELMLVVAIIGVILATGVPAYQRYTIRAQVAEGVTLGGAVKTRVADAYLQTGRPPKNRASTGLSAAPSDTQGKFVESVDIDYGTLVVTFGNDAHRKIDDTVLAMIPYETTDNILVWRCGLASEPDGLDILGTSAGGDTAPLAATTVPEEYLPQGCRD